jgi:hypothetical protein
VRNRLLASPRLTCRFLVVRWFLSQGAYQGYDLVTHLPPRNYRKSVGKFDTVLGAKEAMGKGGRYTGVHRLVAEWVAEPLEEPSYRDLQGVGDLVELRCANTVRSAFVLLYLLKGKSQRLGELFLAELKLLAAKPNLQADVHVDGVWQVGRSRSNRQFDWPQL